MKNVFNNNIIHLNFKFNFSRSTTPFKINAKLSFRSIDKVIVAIINLIKGVKMDAKWLKSESRKLNQTISSILFITMYNLCYKLESFFHARKLVKDGQFW